MESQTANQMLVITYFLYFDILVGKLFLIANGFNSFESKTYLEENKNVNDFAASVLSKLLSKL